MALPVLLCDDSSFARKQMKRALPDGWDIDLTFATNGVERVEAIRKGKGEVVVLDLTMPEMDGYGVREMIRKEDLPAMVIVVSGDIQPDAQERVKKLGAMAFIKKPIDKAKAVQILTEFGILSEVE